MSTISAIQQNERRANLYALHRQWHRDNFDENGAWIGKNPRNPEGDSREWLWHALAFLAGDEADIKLGNTILAATPNVANHFNGVSAAMVLLRYGELLRDETRQHLMSIVCDCHAEARDFAFAVNGVNNFASMWAFYHLAASQILETYVPAYPHQSIPEVYNKYRMRQFGLNVLRLMEAQLDRTCLASEFNSPTYSPISLLHMAEIVNLVNYEPAQQIAARIEAQLWRELLGFHHPILRHVSGPHSRAYTVDTVGHASGFKVLCAFLGLDGDTTVADLIYPPQEGQVIHDHGADPTHQQAFAVWLARGDYHIPAETLDAFRERTFPYTFQGTHEWPGKGYRRPDGSLILNVDGEDSTPSGTGTACCYQEETFALGSMAETYTPANHACHAVYCLDDPPLPPLGGTRTATVVMFHEPVLDDNVLPVHLPNVGHFLTTQENARVSGTVKSHPWVFENDAPQVSANLLISEHLPLDTPVRRAQLNDIAFADSPIETIGRSARFVIDDGSVRITWAVQTECEAVFGVLRQAGFLRCLVRPASAAAHDFNLHFEFDVRNKGRLSE